VATPESPPKGARISFNVSIASIFEGAQLVIRAVAYVVRVESSRQGEESIGFAAAIKTFTMLRPERAE
jgi:hypothetical protein